MVFGVFFDMNKTSVLKALQKLCDYHIIVQIFLFIYLLKVSKITFSDSQFPSDIYGWKRFYISFPVGFNYAKVHFLVRKSFREAVSLVKIASFRFPRKISFMGSWPLHLLSFLFKKQYGNIWVINTFLLQKNVKPFIIKMFS